MTKGRIIPDINPRGLRRPQAAAYVGVSMTKFDELVRDGRMPAPRRVDGCNIWDRHALDDAFDSLPDAAGVSGSGADTWADL